MLLKAIMALLWVEGMVNNPGKAEFVIQSSDFQEQLESRM